MPLIFGSGVLVGVALALAWPVVWNWLAPKPKRSHHKKKET